MIHFTIGWPRIKDDSKDDQKFRKNSCHAVSCISQKALGHYKGAGYLQAWFVCLLDKEIVSTLGKVRCWCDPGTTLAGTFPQEQICSSRNFPKEPNLPISLPLFQWHRCNIDNGIGSWEGQTNLNQILEGDSRKGEASATEGHQMEAGLSDCGSFIKHSLNFTIGLCSVKCLTISFFNCNVSAWL